MKAPKWVPGSGVLLPAMLTKTRPFTVSGAIFHFTVQMTGRPPDHKCPWLRKHCLELLSFWLNPSAGWISPGPWLSPALALERLSALKAISIPWGTSRAPSQGCLPEEHLTGQRELSPTPPVTRAFPSSLGGTPFPCYLPSPPLFPIYLPNFFLLPTPFLLKLAIKRYLSICPMFLTFFS